MTAFHLEDILEVRRALIMARPRDADVPPAIARVGIVGSVVPRERAFLVD